MMTASNLNIEKLHNRKLNSNRLKFVRFEASVTAKANTTTFNKVMGITDYLNMTRGAGFGTGNTYSIWVSGGYGDCWEMSASLYGDGLYVKIRSSFASDLTNTVQVNIIGY